MIREYLAFVALLLAGLGLEDARAAEDAVRLGVLNDMSSNYSESAGKGSLVAVQMAAEDFGGAVIGKKIDVIGADMQNKVDIGVSIGREWFEHGKVDIILDAPNSALALAIAKIADRDDKIFVPSAASSDLTGTGCTAHTVHWGIDTYALAHTTANALLEKGLDSWFLITADYNFGHSLENEVKAVLEAHGGKFLGSARTPLGTTDFSSFVLQAQSSGAKVVGLANAGADAQASIKQASEYGLPQGGQTLASLDIQITHMHALGPDVIKGMYVTDSWYWNLNEQTRAFAERFRARMGRPPSSVQASMYAAATHYLRAVKEAGTDEGTAVIKKMKELPIDVPMWGHGSIRADGRVIYDVYLQQAKAAADVKDKDGWDLVNIVKTIPGDQVFRPMNKGGCPLVSK